jgi:hypothetical protein
MMMRKGNTMLHMTVEDIAAEYAPYHKMQGFRQGVRDYGLCRYAAENYDGVYGQAYDRGAECAIRVARHNAWVKNNVGLD